MIRSMHLPLLAALLLCTCALSAQVEKLAPEPEINTRWVINPDYTDEFNGDALDLDKWFNFHPRWKGRSPAIFLPSQVSVDDGNLVIRNKKLARDTTITLFNGQEVTYNIGGGAVVSRKIEAHYGYYEVNMKASRVKMSSTFWFSNPAVRADPDSDCPTYSIELDVIETIGGTTTLPSFVNNMKSNTHYFENLCGGGRQDAEAQGEGAIGGPTYADFHRYGVNWKNGREFDFYIDGEYSHSINRGADKTLEREMHLNMVTETYDFQPPPTDAELANDDINATYYDFVRGMSSIGIDEEVVLGGGSSADGNLVLNGGFESGDLSGWIGWGGNPREVVTGDVATGDFAVRIAGGGAPEQIIDVTPNTDYTMKVTAKVTAGQVAFGVKPTDANEAIANLIITSPEFTEHTVGFNSGDLSQVKIYFFAMAGANDALGDDFSVIPDGFVPTEPEPVSYAQFPEALEFKRFPLLTAATTTIPADVLYQAATDHDLVLILRQADGTEVARKSLPAKAGYGRRADEFVLTTPFADGTDLVMEAQLRPVGGGDTDVVALGRVLMNVGGTTTSNDNPLLSKPSVSPNPATDLLNVSGIRLNASYQVYDMTGRRLLDGSVTSGSGLSVSDLKPGAYVLRIEGYAPVRFVKR